MQVILLEKVRNLGELGDVVNVRPGYGRNYLMPQGKAVIANAKNNSMFEARRAEYERAQMESLAASRSRAEKMAGVTVQIARRAGEEGRLFGSVGTADIAQALVEAGHTVSKSEIQLPQGPIKAIGTYEIGLSLHSEVHFSIVVSVVQEV